MSQLPPEHHGDEKLIGQTGDDAHRHQPFEEGLRYPTLGLRGVLREEVRPHEKFAILGGLLILCFLVFTILRDDILNPIFPTGALLFFLYPFSRGITTRRIMQLGIVAFLTWLFLKLAGVLFPFIVAFVFAYLFAPFVSYMAKRGVPRWVTSLAVVLLIVGVYSFIGFVVIPAFIGQFDDMMSSIKQVVGEAGKLLDGDKMVSYLRRYGVSQQKAEEIITQYVEPQIESVTLGIVSWLSEFLKNLTDIVEGIANLILIPFISFYMTVDFERLRKFVRTKVLRDDPRYVYYLSNVDGIVNAYIRGILLTSSIVGAFAVAVLSIFNVPFAVVLGILTGLFNLIPTLGMFLNLGVAIVVFIFFPHDFWYNTLVMSATILALHALNSYVIEPRVIGQRVGVHPVLVIGSLFVFAYFLGFIGLLIAVPATAVVMMFLREWYNQTVQGVVPATESAPPTLIHPSSRE